MDSRIESIDRTISYAWGHYRIIWLQSWERDIFYKALNRSAALADRIVEGLRGSRLESDKNRYAAAKQELLKITPKNGYWEFLSGKYEYVVDANGAVPMTPEEANEEIALLALDYACLQAMKPEDSGKRLMALGRGCLYLNDLQSYDERTRGSLLREMLRTDAQTILLCSTKIPIPEGFDSDVLLIDIQPPQPGDIREFIIEETADSPLEKRAIDELVDHMLGCNEPDVRIMLNYLKNSRQLNNPDNRERLAYIDQYKRNLLTKDGMLKIKQISDDEAKGCAMGGYQKWLKKCKVFFGKPELSANRGIDPIKGVLITGLPGTGKTVMAKTTAHELNVPYIEMQMDSLSNDRYGGSEKLMRSYIEKVDAIGSAVVCIDEVEKSLGKEENQGMHEVKRELLQMLLKWMARNEKLFFFFTSNDITKLPPELTRDGRLSERFYTFVPSMEELAEMFYHFLKNLNKKSPRGSSLYGRFINDEEETKRILRYVLRELTKDAVEAEKEEKARNNSTNKEPKFVHRDIFMTGANLEKLIQNANSMLYTGDDKGEEKDPPKKTPYDEQDFLKALLTCAKDPEFIYFGESNMLTIMQLWWEMRENQYRSVSKEPIISLNEADYNSDEEKFVNVEIPEKKKDGANIPPACIRSSDKEYYDYDDWLKYRFKKYCNEKLKKYRD